MSNYKMHKCDSCVNDTPPSVVKNVPAICHYNRQFRGEIDNACNIYEGNIEDLARKAGIAVLPTNSIDDLIKELIEKGKAEEVSSVREKYIESLKPVKEALENLGLEIIQADPFPPSYKSLFVVVKCPKYKERKGA